MPDIISATGVVGTPPSLTIAGSGLARLTFRLASTQRKYNKEASSWENGETNWYTVVAFRRLAENAERSLAKGQRVVVTGRLRVNEWERDGGRVVSVELIADGIGHDLAFGTSVYTRSASTAPASLSDTAGHADAGVGPGGGSAPKPQVDAGGWALPGGQAADTASSTHGAVRTAEDDAGGDDHAAGAEGAELAQLEFATAEPPF